MYIHYLPWEIKEESLSQKLRVQYVMLTMTMITLHFVAVLSLSSLRNLDRQADRPGHSDKMWNTSEKRNVFFCFIYVITWWSTRKNEIKKENSRWKTSIQ